MSTAESLIKILNKAKKEPEMFYNLIFNPEKAIQEAGFDGHYIPNPDSVISMAARAGGCTHSCDASCDHTCGSNSCSHTCGPRSCGYTSARQ